ncbi:MAG: hypothetical protein Q8P04_02260 [bacterium]|nr:hypothetical protein [bacterium]
MDTSKITLPVAVVLALVVGFGAGYWVFRDAPPVLRDDLSLAVKSLITSKTPQNWSVQLSGTVKSWGNNVMELQGEGGTTSVRIVADSNTQFIDSTANSQNPESKSFSPEDIGVGDTLEVVVTFDNNALLRAGFINRVATP